MTPNALLSALSTEIEEDPRYLTEQIVTYLGNKRSLLNFLGRGLKYVKARLGKEHLKAGDLFSGSGIVARFLKKHSEELIVNDLEEYSSLVNTCYLSNSEEVDGLELERHYRRLLRYMETHESPGFITELYAPRNPERITAEDRVFYTRRNALYLDTARQTINLLPEEVRPYFIAPLLAEASIHANTAGVFKGFYKDKQGIGKFGGSGGNALSRILGDISLQFPVFSRFDCRYSIHCRDANELGGGIAGDGRCVSGPPLQPASVRLQLFHAEFAVFLQTAGKDQPRFRHSEGLETLHVQQPSAGHGVIIPFAGILSCQIHSVVLQFGRFHRL